MKPKYSIIVPAHNSANFIAKCLNSIEDQQFDRSMYELIIVCDACSDDTYKVALQYADKVLTTNFGNDGPPRQAGVDAAAGEWIIFLDDDDWFLHEYALSMIDNATDDTTDMVFYGFIWRTVGYAEPIRHSEVLDKDIYWPSVWNKCYRKSFIADTKFRNIPPDPEGHAPDIDWTMRLIAQPFTYNVINQPLYYYNYLRPGSQTVEKVLKDENESHS